jgi:hypothetical protein
VGAGHRGLLNLQYPVYAYSFPLIALSRLNKVLNVEYIFQKVNNELTNNINNRLDIKLVSINQEKSTI